MRPIRRLGYALKRFVTAQEEVYYILKNLRQGSYLRLNERQLFLWNLMDGENTIQDIAVAYMSEYGSLDISILIDLLDKLEAANFLTTSKTNVYEKLDEKISSRGMFYWLQKIGSTYMQKEFPLPRMDEFYTRLYQGGIKYIYTKPVLIPMFVISLLGVAAFIYLITTGEYSLFRGGTSSLSLGIVMLYVASTVALFIHEGGHAFTCKHYGRVIRNSGVMIYYGMVAFYVDSTDIWMESRGPRIMVSFGGPLTGFMLGGIASLVALLSPWQVLNGWFYQFAFLIIIDSAMNLNPLLKWDGYYILMDYLEIPNLRARSFSFLSSGKPFYKLLHREKFNREERIFTIYGSLAIFYSVFFLIGALLLFGDTILDFISNFINPVWLIPIIIVFALFSLRNQIKSMITSLFRRVSPKAR
jgi:putative peptide zinc metalloprotease protein